MASLLPPWVESVRFGSNSPVSPWSGAGTFALDRINKRHWRSIGRSETPKEGRQVSAVDSLGEVQFVALTTFRQSGAPVATTVWVVSDDESLVVTTTSGSGKVKRLRRDSRIELRPSGRRRVRTDDNYLVTGRAQIVEEADEVRRCHREFETKYGWQFRIAMLIERFADERQRVLLRIKLD